MREISRASLHPVREGNEILPLVESRPEIRSLTGFTRGPAPLWNPPNMGKPIPPYSLCPIPNSSKKKVGMSADLFIFYGGAEGESHALACSLHERASPSRVLSRSMGEVLPPYPLCSISTSSKNKKGRSFDRPVCCFWWS